MLGAPVFRTALFGPWSGNALWTAARAVPSLDLCFADKKDLICASSGRQLVTFARASSGTYTDSAGVLQTAATDVPRFDHNPLTGESLGLLVEEQRINLLTRSEEFETTWTTLNSSVSANTTVAPDGTSTADKIIENSTTNVHGVSRGGGSESLANGTVYTFSVYAKAAERGFVWMQALNSFAKSYFNLSTGVVSASGAGHTSTITPVGNGWYRCAITFTSDQTNNSYRAIGMAQVSGTESYAGDGASGLFLWGAQLEAGAFATSYIPTTTAAATRNASLADLISSAIANNIRSFYVEFSSPAVGTRGAASLNDNTANKRIEVITSGTDPRLVVRDGGVEQANINGGTVTAGVKTRVAVRISANDFAISINGSTAATDTSGTLPTVDRLMIGRTQAGEYLNGRIARFAGWTELLSDVTLQSLSQP